MDKSTLPQLESYEIDIWLRDDHFKAVQVIFSEFSYYPFRVFSKGDKFFKGFDSITDEI